MRGPCLDQVVFDNALKGFSFKRFGTKRVNTIPFTRIALLTEFVPFFFFTYHLLLPRQHDRLWVVGSRFIDETNGYGKSITLDA